MNLKTRISKWTVFSSILALSGLSALAAVNLTTFTPGTPIKSAEVNANFSSLKTAVEALEAPGSISSAQLAPSGADGKVLKLAGGKPSWADDLTGGAGGSSYSAGSGLALNGTTFSVADGGVTSSKLSASGAAEGKVLKFSSGGLTWADDQVGTGGGGGSGTTYQADGSSLDLSGTTFSVKDGGISSAKLAAGAVTPSKVAFPFVASGNYGSSGFLVTNTNLSGAAIALVGRGGESAGLSVIGPVGVLGESKVGAGVWGGSTSGTGVKGTSNSGIGVYGESASGNSGYFQGGSGGGGICKYAGGAGWNCTSDRNLKENFQAVNPRVVLERLESMPVSRWNMIGDSSKTPHLGPVAQDFRAAFGLGDSDKTINTADAQGVALTAIKGLAEVVQEKDARIATLSSKLDSLEARLNTLEHR